MRNQEALELAATTDYLATWEPGNYLGRCLPYCLVLADPQEYKAE